MRRAAILFLAVSSVLASACSDDASTAGGDGPTSTTEPRPRGYVAMGDSFSAGVGAPPYDAASGACDRSTVAWPRLLADEERALDLIAHVACGDARLEHLLDRWEDRGEPAQIPAAPNREVGLVTLTIGGNDAGFSDLVARCVLGDCSSVPTSADFRARLEAITDQLATEVYPAIRAAFPEALILHVGYPRLTPAEGVERDDDCSWLSPAEQTATAAIVEQLDAALLSAVASTDTDDVEFVDTYESFTGHELCMDDSWVNDVISFDDGRAHPTAAGYEALAAVVAEAAR